MSEIVDLRPDGFYTGQDDGGTVYQFYTTKGDPEFPSNAINRSAAETGMSYRIPIDEVTRSDNRQGQGTISYKLKAGTKPQVRIFEYIPNGGDNTTEYVGKITRLNFVFGDVAFNPGSLNMSNDFRKAGYFYLVSEVHPKTGHHTRYQISSTDVTRDPQDFVWINPGEVNFGYPYEQSSQYIVETTNGANRTLSFASGDQYPNKLLHIKIVPHWTDQSDPGVGKESNTYHPGHITDLEISYNIVSGKRRSFHT